MPVLNLTCWSIDKSIWISGTDANHSLHWMTTCPLTCIVVNYETAYTGNACLPFRSWHLRGSICAINFSCMQALIGLYNSNACFLCLLNHLCSAAMLVNGQSDDELRPAGSESSRLAGKVEMHFFGHWWSICNDCFTLRVAAVVCRQLGLGYPLRLFNEENRAKVCSL